MTFEIISSDETDGKGTVADFRIPAEEIALENAFAQLNGARVEVEQAVAHGGPEITPYLWVQGANPKPIEAAFAADETVTVVSRPAGAADEWLYRVEWAPAVQAVLESLSSEEGLILTAVGTADSWRLRVLFPTGEALQQAYDEWVEAGLSVEIRRIRAVDTGYVSNVDAPEREK